MYAVIISNWLAGDRNAKVLMITYTALNAASFVALIRYNGLVENNFFVEHVLDMAVVFEAVVLSLALAGKIQQLRQDKIAADIQQRLLQQSFSRRLLSVQEAEKRIIGNALHDNFTHQLLLLKESIVKQFGKHADETRHITQILHDIRHLSHVIHPYMLEKLGLAAALNDMIENIAGSLALDISASIEEPDLDDEQRILVYRIVQECLNNVVKHADADECLVAIHAGDAAKHTDNEIIIKDDGKGFEPEMVASSLGLTTLRERVQMLGGKMTINSAAGKTPSQGTRVHIVFPVKPPKPTPTGEFT